jgi:hypothetical protein
VTCTDFLSQLTDYFDGTVSPELIEEVRQHICECHHCEVVLSTTRHTIEIYRDNEIYELPDDLRTKMHTAIMARCGCTEVGGAAETVAPTTPTAHSSQ